MAAVARPYRSALHAHELCRGITPSALLFETLPREIGVGPCTGPAAPWPENRWSTVKPAVGGWPRVSEKDGTTDPSAPIHGPKEPGCRRSRKGRFLGGRSPEAGNTQNLAVARYVGAFGSDVMGFPPLRFFASGRPRQCLRASLISVTVRCAPALASSARSTERFSQDLVRELHSLCLLTRHAAVLTP